jgi:hypothetical protein
MVFIKFGSCFYQFVTFCLNKIDRYRIVCVCVCVCVCKVGEFIEIEKYKARE